VTSGTGTPCARDDVGTDERSNKQGHGHDQHVCGSDEHSGEGASQGEDRHGNRSAGAVRVDAQDGEQGGDREIEPDDGVGNELPEQSPRAYARDPDSLEYELDAQDTGTAPRLRLRI